MDETCPLVQRPAEKSQEGSGKSTITPERKRASSHEHLVWKWRVSDDSSTKHRQYHFGKSFRHSRSQGNDFKNESRFHARRTLLLHSPAELQSRLSARRWPPTSDRRR